MREFPSLRPRFKSRSINFLEFEFSRVPCTMELRKLAEEVLCVYEIRYLVGSPIQANPRNSNICKTSSTGIRTRVVGTEASRLKLLHRTMMAPFNILSIIY